MGSDIFAALAIATAIKKSDVRRKADDELYRVLDTLGADSLPLQINGEKVGKFSVKWTKAKPRIVDNDRFFQWLEDNGKVQHYKELDTDLIPDDDYAQLMRDHPEWCRDYPTRDLRFMDVLVAGPGGMSVVMPESGEVVPGLEWEPSVPSSTIVTGCDPDKVASALMRGGLPTSVTAALLPEGGV